MPTQFLKKKNENKTIKEQALSTILKNRIFHGGIITKGSGLIKNGENRKGIKSRWYPKTFRDRVIAVGQVKSKLNFVEGVAFTELDKIKNDITVFYHLLTHHTLLQVNDFILTTKLTMMPCLL